jgi:hypothetical protein
MKKIYLLTLACFIAQVTFAQISPHNDLSAKSFKIHQSDVNMSKSVAPFWSEDFSNGIPSTWTNSTVPWVYRGSSTSPNTSVGSQGAYAGTNGPIVSPTAQNGFMIFDSDYYDNLGNAGAFGTGQYPCNPPNGSGHVGLLTTDAIDCSMYPAVSVVFNSFYREYTGIARIAFSIDGGVTWTDTIEVHPDILVNESTASDYQVMLNMPSTVAGNPAVHLQFIYDGTILYNTSFYGYYFWMIDDIQLIETPDHLLVRQDDVFGGWWLGYQTTGDFGLDYTFNPMAQAANNPYRCESVLRNIGASDQTNAELHVSIEDENANIVFSGSSNSITLPFSATDTLAISSNFTPSNMGLYNISFWATSDSFPTTDTLVRSTIITDSVYGIDYDWNSDGANMPGSRWLVGRSCGGQVVANAFDIYENTQVTSISFFVDDESIAGAEVAVQLYETDGQIYLAESDPYYLQNSDLGSWVTVPLLNPYPLFAGTSYMAAVKGSQHPTDTMMITSLPLATNVSYIQDNGCDIGTQGFGFWYTATTAMGIRMNFGDISLFNENKEKTDINIYPNPTNGTFTITTDRNETCEIIIDNILGQTVYSSIYTNLNSASIDMSKFDKGVYLVKVKYEDSSSVTNIVIE